VLLLAPAGPRTTPLPRPPDATRRTAAATLLRRCSCAGSPPLENASASRGCRAGAGGAAPLPAAGIDRMPAVPLASSVAKSAKDSSLLPSGDGSDLLRGATPTVDSKVPLGWGTSECSEDKHWNVQNAQASSRKADRRASPTASVWRCNPNKIHLPLLLPLAAISTTFAGTLCVARVDCTGSPGMLPPLSCRLKLLLLPSLPLPLPRPLSTGGADDCSTGMLAAPVRCGAWPPACRTRPPAQQAEPASPVC
jgi:hypothetical protein